MDFSELAWSNKQKSDFIYLNQLAISFRYEKIGYARVSTKEQSLELQLNMH